MQRINTPHVLYGPMLLSLINIKLYLPCVESLCERENVQSPYASHGTHQK